MSHVSRTKLHRWAFLVVAVVGLALIVAGSTALAFRRPPASEVERVLPGRVQRLEGTNVDRVILTAAAIQRLGIATEPIRDSQVSGTARKVLPYAAVLYDPAGDTWTYTNPEPLVFVREHVAVDSIQGNQAVLSSGPAAGTAVVTVGAIELYGTEVGVSGDE